MDRSTDLPLDALTGAAPFSTRHIGPAEADQAKRRPAGKSAANLRRQIGQRIGVRIEDRDDIGARGRDTMAKVTKVTARRRTMMISSSGALRRKHVGLARAVGWEGRDDDESIPRGGCGAGLPRHGCDVIRCATFG